MKIHDVALLDDAIRGHGGDERWASVARIDLRVRIGGNILAFKGASPFTRVLDCRVDTRAIRATLSPFPRAGCRGVFEADGVRIESDARVIAERRLSPADAETIGRRRLIWTDLDVLYFLGYALWNYTVTPYVFRWPGFVCREGAPWREAGGATWRSLDVEFPSHVPTHSRRQTFYFDAAGLLRRLDYTAEVFAGWARGAHLCEGHRPWSGLMFPAHRIVFPRRVNGRPLRLFSVMEGWIDDVVVVE
jgi:hypothetical protein